MVYKIWIITLPTLVYLLAIQKKKFYWPQHFVKVLCLWDIKVSSGNNTYIHLTWVTSLVLTHISKERRITFYSIALNTRCHGNSLNNIRQDFHVFLLYKTEKANIRELNGNIIKGSAQNCWFVGYFHLNNNFWRQQHKNNTTWAR